MRLLLLALLTVLVLSIAAPAAEQQPLTPENALQAPKANAEVQTEIKHLPPMSRKDLTNLIRAMRESGTLGEQYTCLKIRSMHFKREGRDRVAYQRMTTCTPSSQFQMKNAVVEPAQR